MATTIGGLKLYRPTKSIKREFFKDNYGENIGVKDEISFTDTVLSSDSGIASLVSHADNIVDLVGDQNWKQLSEGGSTSDVQVISVEIDSNSDYRSKLIYTITVESYPDISLNTKWPIVATDGVRELSSDESIEHPTDINVIGLEDGNTYANKPVIFTCNIQLSCGPISLAHNNAHTLAKDAIKKLKKTKPDELIQKVFGQKYASYTKLVTRLQESYGEDGSATLQITTNLIHPGATSSDVLLTNEDISIDYIKTPNEHKKISYKVTFLGLGNIEIDPDNPGIKTEAKHISAAAESKARGLVDYYQAAGSNTPITAFPGKVLVCPPPQGSTPLPDLPENSCYNTTSVGIEVNHNDGTATAIIEASTEPTNCDGDGYQTTWNINHIKNKKTYAELFGWGVEKSIVQDLKCEASEVKQLTVNVSSASKCLVSELKNKAETKYNELKAEIEQDHTDVTLTQHRLTLGTGKCSINATFFLGSPSTIQAT